jgi:hypothetical protein
MLVMGLMLINVLWWHCTPVTLWWVVVFVIAVAQVILAAMYLFLWCRKSLGWEYAKVSTDEDEDEELDEEEEPTPELTLIMRK